MTPITLSEVFSHRHNPYLHLACDPDQLAWRDAGSLRVLAALPVTF